jgi:hypothetical protein
MSDERASARDCSDATVIRGGGIAEQAEAHGRYEVECIGADGKLKWRDTIDNVVCTVGKNLMLDTAFAGAAYTVTGPYMGLISSTSYSAVAAGDTMASHAGWLEVPSWSTARAPVPPRMTPAARCGAQVHSRPATRPSSTVIS